MKIMKRYSLLMMSALVAVCANATEPKDVHIYVNPGHGGHDSDDRNVTIYPYASGDPEGFWESNSNLDKGLMLRDILEGKGCKVTMSRTTNTTADDLGLETIGTLANNSGADIFFSIHSNATGTDNRSNFPLMLFRGYTNQPVVANSDKLAQLLLPHLYSNGATVWTGSGAIYGDWNFYPSWGTQGLGVLRVLSIPGMLSEGSFHDYIPETYRLMNMDFKWMESWEFVQAINDYFGLQGEDVGYVAGCVYDSRVLRTDSYKKFGRDNNLAICGAKVTLKDAEGKVLSEYTTDQLYNGFYLFKSLAPGEYTVEVAEDGHYNATQAVTVTANAISYANIPMNKVRDTAPEVIDYSPKWKEGDPSVLCNTPIVIKFNWDMDIASAESALTIEPAIEGKLTWEDSNYQVTFTPNGPYKSNTVYTVKLAKSAMHGGGTPMNEDLTFQFSTDERRYLYVTEMFPHDNGTIHYASPVIEIRTDSVMDCSNIAKQVSVEDKDGNVLGFNGRTFKYGKNADGYGFAKWNLSKNLEAGESYKLIAVKEIADLKGITLERDTIATFTAENVAEGQNPLSVVNECEDASALVLDEATSANFTSTSVATSATALFGKKSLELKYAFSGKKDGVITYKLAEPYTGDASGLSSWDVLGLYVNGDNCGHELYALYDNGTQTIESKIANIDFHGWKYMSFTGEAGEWTGASTSLVGFRLKQTPGKIGLSGSFKMDNLVLDRHSTGVDKINIAGLKVYPNPSSDYIVASADMLIEGMQLIGQNGAVVAQSGNNVINVSEVPVGNYIVVVKANGNSSVVKVIVKH